MSSSMSVFVADPIPTPVQVQDVAKTLGFDVAIHDAQSPFESSSGFRPMTFGHPKPLEAGVEIYVSNADDFARDNGIEVAAHFTRVIWFRWGASFPELYSASVISAALASIGGKVYFDEEGRFKTTEEIAAEALSVLRFIKP